SWAVLRFLVEAKGLLASIRPAGGSEPSQQQKAGNLEGGIAANPSASLGRLSSAVLFQEDIKRWK
ncbi:MAG: hypothetical protein OEV22_14825, partial [Deltaproteobacteria bacterium]|nr:hypothetical protein [Deltaproteobacteria bacterium]